MPFACMIFSIGLALWPLAAEAVQIAPVQIEGWSGPNERAVFPGPIADDLATLDQRRATLIYDLTNVIPSTIGSISLRMIPIRFGPAGVLIEGIGLSTGNALDPFVWTLESWARSAFPQQSYAGEAGPCYLDPVSCPTIQLGGYGMSKPPLEYLVFDLDVTSAADALYDGPLLQISVLPGNENQFARLDWPGGQTPNGGAVLDVALLPEPGLDLLLAVGVAATAARGRSRSIPSVSFRR